MSPSKQSFPNTLALVGSAGTNQTKRSRLPEPLYEILQQTRFQVMTGPIPTPIPYIPSAAAQIVGWVVLLLIIAVSTMHVPLPQSSQRYLTKAITSFLAPISSAVPAFNTLMIFAVKIVRGKMLIHRGRRTALHDAISAGAVAIELPSNELISEDPCGWRRLPKNVPCLGADCRGHARNSDGTALYSIPPTSRFRVPPVFTVVPSSNMPKAIFKIAQIVYAGFVGYMLYGGLIGYEGLSSPFLTAIPLLYFSFINSTAGLVQRSYSYIVVIPRSPVASPPPDERNQLRPNFIAQPAAGMYDLEASDETIQRVQTYLRDHYPQIEFGEPSNLSTIAFFLHHSLALTVMVFWAGLLTGFKPGAWSDIFIVLGLVMDSILRILLAAAQRWHYHRGWLDRLVHGLGCAVAAELMVWSFNLIGYFVAGKRLYEIYYGR